MVLNDTLLSFGDIGVKQVKANTVLSHDGTAFAVLKGTDATDIGASDFAFDIV